MRVLFLLIMACMADMLIAQTILDDAKKLSKLFSYKPDEEERVTLVRGVTTFDPSTVTILRQYYPEEFQKVTDTNILRDKLKSAFENNPFIRTEITDQDKITFMPISNTAIPIRSQTTGFSVMNFADGLAQYLVTRTKQELSKAFLENFSKKVQSEPLLSFFCPFTKVQLSVVDSKVYDFNNYLLALRESFIADMASLPGNTELFLKSENYCKGCADKDEGKIMIDLLHVGQQMVNGESPINMITYLAHPDFSSIQTAEETNPNLYNMATGLRFVHLISESLRNPNSVDPRKPWYSARQIQAEFQDPKLLRIYLGLLWQKAESIYFVRPDSLNSPTPLRKLLVCVGKIDESVYMWRKSIESMGESIHLIQCSLGNEDTANISIANQFFSYSQAISDLLMAVNKTGHLLLNDKEDIVPVKYILLMKQCNALYFNVQQRNYGMALSNIIYCLHLLKDGDSTEKKNISALLKYMNFMAAIAEANSAEEIERTIEIYALPPGSSEEKKDLGRFSAALNAYTGLTLGWEKLGQDQSSKTIGAVTTPLGLDFSVGLGKSGSIGAFVPLIDVGAITAYRFKDDNAGDLPELTWSNILSPGLYIVYGTPGKLPFAFGYGAQIGPSIRKVFATENGVNVEVEKSGWRQGFFLSVDIPITYFYLGKGRSRL